MSGNPVNRAPRSLFRVVAFNVQVYLIRGAKLDLEQAAAYLQIGLLQCDGEPYRGLLIMAIASSALARTSAVAPGNQVGLVVAKPSRFRTRTEFRRLPR